MRALLAFILAGVLAAVLAAGIVVRDVRHMRVPPPPNLIMQSELACSDSLIQQQLAENLPGALRFCFGNSPSFSSQLQTAWAYKYGVMHQAAVQQDAQIRKDVAHLCARDLYRYAYPDGTQAELAKLCRSWHVPLVRP